MNEKLKDLEADACTVRQGPRKWGNLAEKLEDTKGGEECGESFQDRTSNSKANVLDKQNKRK